MDTSVHFDHETDFWTIEIRYPPEYDRLPTKFRAKHLAVT
jgi:hypothetical protein